MKRFLAIILTVLVIAATVFCVHSCKKNGTKDPAPSDSTNPSAGLVGYGSPDEKKEPEKKPEEKKTTDDKPTFPGTPSDNSTVYTGIGIYHGRTDSARVEITLDTELQPILISSTLTPELAESFSSLNLEEDTIISFEYQIINDQYVISKIIK